MEDKTIKYYLYKDQPDTSGDKILEEDELIKQLQDAISSSNDQHSEDEICAAIGMMLMHYQAVTQSKVTPKKKSASEIEEPKQNPLQPKPTTTNDQNTQNVHLDIMMQPIPNNDSNYNNLLASCRNILKEFMTQNGYF